MYRLAQVSRRHHRPVRRPGRAVRPRVRRPARQPQLRRRAGVAHVLRAGPDRPAAAARRVPGAHAPGARRQRDALPARRDARPRREGRARRRASCAATSRPATCSRCPGTRSCSRPAATATSSTCRPTRRTRNVTAAWRRREARRVLRQPVLHADPPHVHPGERRLPVEAHADVGVVAQRRPGLGARSRSTTRARPTRSPRHDRDYFLERRYPSFGNLVRPRRRVTRDQARGRRRPRRRAAEERRVPRLRRRDQAPRATT